MDTSNIYVKLDDVVKIFQQMKQVAQKNFEANKGGEHAKLFEAQVESLTTAEAIVNHESFNHFKMAEELVPTTKLYPIASWNWYNNYKPNKDSDPKIG